MRRRYRFTDPDSPGFDSDDKPRTYGPRPVRAWIEQDRGDGRWNLTIELDDRAIWLRFDDRRSALQTALDDESVSQLFVWNETTRDFVRLSRAAARELMDAQVD